MAQFEAMQSNIRYASAVMSILCPLLSQHSFYGKWLLLIMPAFTAILQPTPSFAQAQLHVGVKYFILSDTVNGNVINNHPHF